MNVYKLPETISGLIFDMDLTLYTNSEYGKLQIDRLVERLGKTRGKSFQEMDRELEEFRVAFAASHGGRRPSLSAALLSYGVSMEENVRWREEAYEPADFIHSDPKLGETLKRLSSSFALGVVTNNPVLVARKTLSALGAEQYFTALVGLDTCMTPKPHRLPFLTMTELLGCPAETCVSIGDRYDIDLAVPLELGMGGILVGGVEDVYLLPALLLPQEE
jgi:phosphoglycolate phosphatase/putative hydrolase of the HAD superfamily